MGRRKSKIFYNVEQRNSLLKNIYTDYVENNMTIPQMAEEYGYSKRQIRYIIDRYLCIRKGSGKHMGKREDLDIKIRNGENSDKDIEEYISNGYFVTSDGKVATLATVEDLMKKSEKYRKNTNKKVENK